MEKLKLVKIVCPTVTTQATLTVPMSALGIDNMSPPCIKDAHIVAKTTSAGVGQVEDDTISISGTNIVIAEGSTGFTTGDIFYVLLRLDNENTIQTATATAS